MVESGQKDFVKFLSGFRRFTRVFVLFYAANNSICCIHTKAFTMMLEHAVPCVNDKPRVRYCAHLALGDEKKKEKKNNSEGEPTIVLAEQSFFVVVIIFICPSANFSPALV